ncbi:MAG: hypothetical protein ACLFTW_15425 [Chitinispirillaceae bacterium]
MRQLTFLFMAVIFLSQVPSSAQQRSIIRFGEDVAVAEGEQVKDAVSIGGDVRIEGEVKNDAVAVGGSLFLGPQATVEGSAVSIGGRINQSQTAVVKGDIVEMSTPWEIPSEAWFGLFVGLQILAFLGFLALALLLVALVPKQVQSVSRTAVESVGRSFLWGILVILAIIPVTVLLAITIVGIALIPVLYVVIILIFVFGYIGIANLIGVQVFKGVNREKAAMIWKALVGLLLLGLMNVIPVFGGLIAFLASIWGAGAVIEALIQYRNITRAKAQERAEHYGPPEA